MPKRRSVYARVDPETQSRDQAQRDRIYDAADKLALLMGVDPERIAYDTLGINLDVDLAEQVIARLQPQPSRDEVLIAMEREAAERRAARALESAITRSAK